MLLQGMNIRIKRAVIGEARGSRAGRVSSVAGVVLVLLLVAGASAHAGRSALACPAQDLSTFLIAFAESIDLQKTFTRFPLKYVEDHPDGEFEVPPRISMFNPEQAKFPLIRNTAERRDLGLLLLMNVDEEKAQQAQVTEVKEDTGWQVQFYFERTSSCWELIRIEDQSS